eukprot:TRINITY_DN14450_c0_g1_i1.p1 TRINITY_DN14450_c0_g1~~TRINITY_DN14450_c0_g1_i1.p1  ORF type:complete len:575 (-),score=67.73 TRINITY_DN14450_c0_g1_i1:184-1908(-)
MFRMGRSSRGVLRHGVSVRAGRDANVPPFEELHAALGLGQRGCRRKRGDGLPQRHDDELSDPEVLDDLGVPLDAVVKVWCVHSRPNFSLPWQRRKQYRSSGTGFVIDVQRKIILSNAHCVEWHAQVKVQRRGQDRKHLAKVLDVGWECDCAVLTVEDDTFWEGVQAVKLSDKVPRLEEPVLCVGFPLGGETISVTRGVVSRVEVMMYAHASAELLAIQIDAAITSGNSGGPAFDSSGECLGVAFQSLHLEQAENIGYVIPTVVITHFLDDLLKHGRYTGFPTLGIVSQTMENVHLRQAYGMSPKQKGLLVCRICPTSAVAKVLQAGDILLAFDGEAIANDGTVSFRKHERVSFSWLVSQKFYGESVTLTVFRDREEKELHIEDFHVGTQLVPIHLFDVAEPHQGPTYLIVAGVVFTHLSVPFLRSEFGEDWHREAPIEFVHRLHQHHAAHPDEKIVILTNVLANALTVGYEDLEDMILVSVNDVKVRNLKHVREVVKNCLEDNLCFGLHNHHRLVLNTVASRAATVEVLEQHCIPAEMSADLSGGSVAQATTTAKVETRDDDDSDDVGNIRMFR